ncbi:MULTISPECIES: magnesium transporter [Paracoccus]|uniref:Magnesium transporter MgtE n=1 Tax=Paracoccus versutus TaxID=34007 RepID=A0A3D9XQ06_PARVE|nr:MULTISPECIES: magnesium transporter [Paracoccus]MCJ1902631.1 magnesium transporter [Paracoccus versutus]MDF3907220.1 magnesium transporter [Paracoccus sp. AS002]REF68969.1 Mg2+ transporter MgtE [Paracoccus versutus]WGR57127.1 magnesium transporter [Paracoccus versutus]
MTEPRETDTDAPEADFQLSRQDIDAINKAVDDGDGPALDAALEPMHAADIADLIEQLTPARRREFLHLYSGEIDGEILSEIDESIRDEVIEQLPHEVVAEAVREMDSDDVVDLIEDMGAPEQQAILAALDESDRAAVERSLTWPEYSAGRLMQSEVVTAPEHWSVGETIDFLRAEEWLPDQFYHVVLVDPRRHPTGYVTLGKLLASRRHVLLGEIREDSFRTISARQDEGDVAHAFNKYHLISAPVVDDDDRLVGVITIDDAMSVLDEEHEEDILRLAGVGEDSAISDTVVETMRQRVPWLAVNILTALVSASVIAFFEDAIARLVALAVLMPIVASMGGNAATQTLTVAVRGLATKSLTRTNALRIVRRELAVGLGNGLLFGLALAGVTYVWFRDPKLSLVIAMAMVVNLFVAALGGILIPLGLEKAGADPALASGTFVTTVTDVVGFFTFLGLAAVILL